MEKSESLFYIIFAIGILLFSGFNVIRCAFGGYDLFYTIMFALMFMVGRWLFRYSVAEYKASTNGNHKQHADN